MTKYAGSDLVVNFDSQLISDHGAVLDVDEEHAAPDVTSFGDNDGTYIAGGVTHRKATFDGFDDTAQTIFNKLVPGASGDLEYYPQGNSVGLPVVTVNAIVTKRKRGFKIGDKVALSVEFQLDGVVTEGVVPGP